jgi:ELWxxDGT repeat protein
MRVTAVFTVALALAAASGARAQAPYLVKDIWPGFGFGYPTAPVIAFGDRVYFGAESPDLGWELWSTGGTEESTTVLELAPGANRPAAPYPLVSLDTGVLFADYRNSSAFDPELWRTDGTLAGTQWVSGLDPLRPLARSADQALLGNGIFGGRPFVTDGTPGGTFLVPPPPGGAPAEVQLWTPAATFAGGFAIAVTSPSGPYPQGAWWTDGTPSGTRRLVDAPAECYAVAAAGGRLYILCRQSTGGPANALFVSDGTSSGTQSVAAFEGSPTSLVSGDDLVFFRGYDWLGRSDGTVAGTGPIPPPSPAPVAFLESGAVVSRGVLYFRGDTPAAGTELWRSDGTAAGTFMLRDIEPGTGSAVASFFSIAALPGGGVIFAATTSAAGTELWKSDGTAAGTVPLPEIAPGPDSSLPGPFTVAGGRVYFPAWDPPHGRELWALDLAKGAVEVDDTFVQEGNAGTTTATFTVRLQSAATVPVVVSYQTVAVTAEAGTDYAAQSGTLTFVPGEREKAVDVPVFGDVVHERNESLKLELTAVGGAVIADRVGALVILDDEAQPRVRAVGAAPVVEDFTDAVFGVTLETDGSPLQAAVSVRYATVAGTATAGTDFSTWWGTITFPAGSPSGTTLPATVPVRDDSIDEPNETFSIALDGLSETIVTGGPASVLILDDDGIAAAPPVELSHGTTVRADLAPPSGPGPDRDFYVLVQHPSASYELVVDEASGDAAPLSVQRIAADGTTVLQSAAPVGTGTARSLRWENSTFDPISNQHIRIESPSCGTVCGADDTYRVRFYETTLRGARVNNTNGQVTLLLLQNLTDAPVSGFVHLRTEDGGSGGGQGYAIPPRGTLVFDTSQNLFVPGSGWVTHDAPYGGVAGKAVGLEPATGFIFETPLTSRPR